MDRGEAARKLSALLAELKRRSGLSYQDLGKRVFTSSSTLHRYCSGQGTPPEYDLVVRVAGECRASPEELNDLLAYWRAATGQAPQVHDPATVEAPPPAPPPVTDAGEPHRISPSADTPRGPDAGVLRRRRRVARVVFAAATVIALLGAVVSSAPRDSRPPAAAAPAGMTSWSQNPSPIPRELFGVTMNSSSGALPDFPVGGVRLWDSETRWAQLQPARGQFEWSTLDRLLDATSREDLPTLFVFGGTPTWAAPDARKAAYPDGSRAAPPDDLADWEAFVQGLVRHAGARIDAYELWVMANHEHHYNGPVETLVEMTRRASRIIKAQDETATVVCPSVTALWTEESHAFIRMFAALGGYQYCDAAGVKLYQERVTDPPETMLTAIRRVDLTFQQAGYHLPLWNTGTTQTLQLNAPLDPETAADYAVRFYLTGLFARNRGVQRMYFYAWGNGKIPLVLQAEGQPPTKAGAYVGRLGEWLTGALVRGCGHGQDLRLPPNVWQCEVMLPDEHGTLRSARISWTHGGTAEVPAGQGAERVRRLDGTEETVRSGDVITVTGRPVLIDYRG
ncbi:helix-turn-helix domain-containing protein [Streptodolium elevatio]